MPLIQPTLKHVARTDRFRGELDFTDELSAFEAASQRSLEIGRKYFVTKDTNGVFTMNAHGVERIGYKTVAVFSRGLRVQ